MIVLFFALSERTYESVYAFLSLVIIKSGLFRASYQGRKCAIFG